jgi:putative transposase
LNMPRIARVAAVGLPRHITQRGNYRQDVFLDDNDRKNYLLWIQEYSQKYHLSILTYCLMRNHVHFVAILQRGDSLARTFNASHMRYSQYFNRKMGGSGHLWQGRFYSCVLDEPHLLMTAKYIERNPVRTKLIKKPWEWIWSSAGAHTGSKAGFIRLGNLFDLIDMSCQKWKQYIDSKEIEAGP